MQRIAVVTGASSGIGEATARALTAHGWRCVLVARREDLLRKLADEIGGEVEVVRHLRPRGRRGTRPGGCWSVIPRSTSSSTTPACLARGTFLKADLDADRARDPGQLPRRRLVLARLAARARGGAAQTGGAHVVNMVSVARHGLVRPRRRLRSLEARPARVLALARGGAARHRHLGALDHARLRRDARASRRRAFSRAGSCCRFVIEPGARSRRRS